MKFSYEDLISGDAIPVKGVGHIRSPKIHELKPTIGIGILTYHLYLNILSWGKDDLIKFMRVATGKPLQAFENADKLNVFDVATLLDPMREQLQEAMAFFIDEEVMWDKAKRSFITKSKDNHNEIGHINRDNFDDVRDMMLQVNYISLGRLAKPVKFSSNKAESLWEKAQQHLKTQAKSSEEDKRSQLGNIISKLSCVQIGYTLLNIYDLTVFQLYDQFLQYGYLRAMGLNDAAFTNHGGKDFDMQAWLKPITN